MPQLSPEMSLLFVSVFLDGMLAMYFLFGIRPKQLGTYIMGSLFLANFLSTLCYIMAYEGTSLFYPISRCVESVTISMLFLYVKSYVIKDYKLAGKELLHFFPVPLVIGFSILDYTLLQERSLKQFFLGFSLWIITYIYLFLALRLVKRYKKEVSNQFSNLVHHNANWLNFLCYLFLIYHFFPLTVGAFNELTDTTWADYQAWQLSLIALIPLVYNSLFLWKVLQNAAVMQGIEAQNIQQKYASSKLNEQEKKTQLAHVQTLMKTEQPFLNPDLKITDLAKTMDTSPRVISQIINEKLNQNFYDFTNSYRIDYAKELLIAENSKQTISEVLYASGFNSKSSFNTAFKKFTKTTPTQFKKQL